MRALSSAYLHRLLFYDSVQIKDQQTLEQELEQLKDYYARTKDLETEAAALDDEVCHLSVFGLVFVYLFVYVFVCMFVWLVRCL